MPLDLSTLLDPNLALAFLGGTAVGAAGKYLADKFTDQRHKKEEQESERQKFADLKKMMPKLLAEIKEDLIRNEALHLRELVILANRGLTFNHGQPRMEYFETEHPSVRNQFVTLISEGFVEVASDGQVPIYRLKEAFVKRVVTDG